MHACVRMWHNVVRMLCAGISAWAGAVKYIHRTAAEIAAPTSQKSERATGEGLTGLSPVSPHEKLPTLYGTPSTVSSESTPGKCSNTVLKWVTVCCTSCAPIVSRTECIDHWAGPTSTQRMPVAAERIGPMVEPHGQSCPQGHKATCNGTAL